MSENRLQDRCGVGQSGCFDHDAIESGEPFVVEIACYIFKRADQFTAHGAAQAARGQQYGCFVFHIDEEMIQSDIAKFIDNDEGSGHGGIMQQVIEQSGFACTQKSGQNKKRNGDRWFCHGV